MSKVKKSKGKRTKKTKRKRCKRIKDKYTTIKQVQAALRRAGLESSDLVMCVDFTKSNTYNGIETFNGKSLHHLSQDTMNPYEQAISVIGKTLEPFDDDNQIPAYGFGDSTTKDKSVFPFYDNDKRCQGFSDVLNRYRQIVQHVKLLGPTSFAPAINKTIEIVKREQSYHILVIIADGEVTSVKQTKKAIIKASKYPISIIVIGVGDGPWDLMNEFDDKLPKRKFDNFQFVEFNAINRDAEFAMHALMEIPDQYKAIKKLGLLDFPDQSTQVCCICMDYPVDTHQSLMPCGHTVICGNCIQRFVGSPCPICRQSVTGIFKSYS